MAESVYLVRLIFALSHHFLVVENAKIALIDSAIEIEKTEMSAEIRINEPQQMQMFLNEENKMLKSIVDKVISAGANVVLYQKGIDDIAQHYLAKKDVLALRRVKENNIYKLSKATGAKVINNLDEMTDKDLGYADLVEDVGLKLINGSL
jgi:archaeal chaperonin